DVSEVHTRADDPQVREISRLEWDDKTIPQVAIPVTIKGRPYVVEIDEFATDGESLVPQARADAIVGAARIIDISDETKPLVVSNIRLEVNTPEGRRASMGDPGTSSSLQGYTGHYCAVPRNEEPGIVACSFVASGLRVFDIRDPFAPREIAYFNKPTGTSGGPGDFPTSYAMSASAFVPERGEIWYLDGNSGLHVLRFTNGVWPFQPARAGSSSGTDVADAGAARSRDTLPSTGWEPWPFLAPGMVLAAVGLRRALRRL
ncbi:MAG: hypothetical protein ACLGHT_00325, partial [Acidimicrobiia bacterium]